MTIEFWLYLPRLLEKDEWWSLIAKPGIIHENGKVKSIYQILMRHSTKGTDMISGIGNRKGGTFVLGLGFITAPYEPKWMHVAIQVQLRRTSFTYWGFVDGRLSGGAEGNSGLIEDSDFPLYVGGLPTKSTWSGPIPVGAFEGFLDEIRISDEFRYVGGYAVPRRFEPDKHTVALWHFDEGPGKLRYKDASGKNDRARCPIIL